MASKAQYKCQTCEEVFMARIADRKRGWARFCSKSCKAIKQEQRTGQYNAHRNRTRDEFVGGFGEWDEHKDDLTFL